MKFASRTRIHRRLFANHLSRGRALRRKGNRPASLRGGFEMLEPRVVLSWTPLDADSSAAATDLNQSLTASNEPNDPALHAPAFRAA